MSLLRLRTPISITSIISIISIQLCLLSVATGDATAQQLAPPAPSAPQKLEVARPHVPIMIWGHDSAWLQQLREAQATSSAASAQPAQQEAAGAEPEAKKLVIQVESAPGSDQQGFSFRDITDRSQPHPEVLPMADRSRTVQEYRRSLMGKPKSTGGAQP